MSEISKSLIVSFDALNLVKGIKSIGGPDKQVYYIESNLFAPDRRITPLILQPYILVEDPHEIISSGDKVGELSSAEWYFDEIKSENRITAKEENASIDTPFALGANNSLHIRKNVEKAIQLFFEAEFLDTRKNKNIHISLTYLLTTTQSSEVKPAPKLKLSKPQSWKYCPLNKITEATIEAEVFADNKGYKSAVEWCKVEGDKVTPLTDEPFVIGGQNTDKLKVNPHVMGDSLIRARNVSEEFYNKVYGINPEWDSRMKEVFENRNLITSTAIQGGWYDVKDGTISGSNAHYRTEYNKPIEISDKATYVAQGKERMVILYYSKDNKYISSIDLKDLPKTITPPSGANLVRMFFLYPSTGLPPRDSLIADYELKLAEGSKVTPFTPAPEELNFRNEVISLENVDRWNNQNVIKTLDKDVLHCLADKNGYFGVFSREPSFTTTSNDLFYIKLNVTYSDKGSVTFGFNSQVAEKNTAVFQLQANVNTNISAILPRGRTDDIVVYSHNGVARRSFLDLKDIVVINLSKIFGQGKEPLLDVLNSVFFNKTLPNPHDLAPDGILQGTYQSDIKFTKYFPDINAEILFLTGDSIRPEHKTVKAQALFATNKEPINNPSEFFDIEWYLDPVEAGGEVKKIGTGEFMEIPITDLQLKGGRLVPIRLKYNFK